MPIKVAINGFGRIGRLVFRILHESYPDIEVVAVNDLVPPDNLAYLLKFDSVHRSPSFNIKAEGEYLNVDGKSPSFYLKKTPLSSLGRA